MLLSEVGVDYCDWEMQKAMFRVGQTVVGRVVRQARFGVFVALDADAVGLIEIPELSLDDKLSPDQYPKIGELVEAKVLGFRERNKQIVLSVRALRDTADGSD